MKGFGWACEKVWDFVALRKGLDACCDEAERAVCCG